MRQRIRFFLGNCFILGLDGLKREEGQTATEYAVVLAVIVIGAGGATIPLRNQIVAFIGRLGDAFDAVPF